MGSGAPIFEAERRFQKAPPKTSLVSTAPWIPRLRDQGLGCHPFNDPPHGIDEAVSTSPSTDSGVVSVVEPLKALSQPMGNALQFPRDAVTEWPFVSIAP
jgi:hypothetical protein